jgi:hypothetical protein
MKFEQVIEEAVISCGSASNLALELETTDQEITRMRKPGAKVSVPFINKLLKLSELCITSTHERDNLISAALTFTELYKRK